LNFVQIANLVTKNPNQTTWLDNHICRRIG